MSNRVTAAASDRLELLETFLRIVESGGFGAAARMLDTTQPTVTRRLQQLESLLDARLIERGAHGVSLTSAGASLLPEAQDMLQRWSGLAATTGDDEQATIAGLVRVAAASPIGAELLPHIFAGFVAEHPEVRLDLRLKDGGLDLVGEGVDFAVRLGKQTVEGATTREIARMRWALGVSPELARKLSIEIGASMERCEPLALADQALITLAPFAGARHRFLGRSDAIEEVRFEVAASFDSVEASLRFAVEGFGLAILPDWRLQEEVAAGRLARAAADWRLEDLPVSLSWIPTRFRSAAASSLMSRVQRELPELLGEE